jgi:hypothetical protein
MSYFNKNYYTEDYWGIYYFNLDGEVPVEDYKFPIITLSNNLQAVYNTEEASYNSSTRTPSSTPSWYWNDL